MISDTLFDAIVEIDRYLTDPVFAGAYAEADVRAHVQRVREEMESLRVRLDEVAPVTLQTIATSPPTSLRSAPGRWCFAWRNPGGSEHRSAWTGTEEEARRVCVSMNQCHPDTTHWPEIVAEEKGDAP